MKFASIIEMLHVPPAMARTAAAAQVSNQSPQTFKESLLATSKASSDTGSAADGGARAGRHQKSVSEDAKETGTVSHADTILLPAPPQQRASQQVPLAQQARFINLALTTMHPPLAPSVAPLNQSMIAAGQPMRDAAGAGFLGVEPNTARPAVVESESVRSSHAQANGDQPQAASILPSPQIHRTNASVAPVSQAASNVSNAVANAAPNVVSSTVQDSISDLIQPAISNAPLHPETVPVAPAALNTSSKGYVAPAALNASAKVDVAPAALNASAKVDVAAAALNASAKVDVAAAALNASAKVDVVPAALNASAKGEAAPAALNASAKGEAAPAALNASAKGDVVPAALNASAKGDAAAAALNASAKGEAAPAALNASAKGDVAPAVLNTSAKGDAAPAALNASAKGDVTPTSSPASTDQADPPVVAPDPSGFATDLGVPDAIVNQLVALIQPGGLLVPSHANLDSAAVAKPLAIAGADGNPGANNAANDTTGLKQHAPSASDHAGSQTGSQDTASSGDQSQGGASPLGQSAAPAQMSFANHTINSIDPAQNTGAASPLQTASVPVGIAVHTAKAQDTAAPASIALPEALPVINTAKLIQNMGQTEMRVGMRSNEFGNISISTSATRDLISAQISLDHGGLARELAIHLPEMQARLGGNQAMDVRIDMNGQGVGTSAGMTNGSADQSHGERQQQGSTESSRSSNSVAEQGHSIAAAAMLTGEARVNSRLDITA